MLIIPAIDILRGCCVRLKQGDYNAVSVYDENPTAVAKSFFDAGVRRLHIVDLDAAKAGEPVNAAQIYAILKAAEDYDNVRIDIGGGLRTPDTVSAVLDAGAAYAILGTAAVADPDFRRAMIAQYPDKILIGLDARHGKLATRGWTQTEAVDAVDFIHQELNATPPAGIIYTDINRDGMLSGVNITATEMVAKNAACPVIASGGVHDISDIEQMKKSGHIAGVVIGQAIYSGKIQLADALAVAAA